VRKEVKIILLEVLHVGVLTLEPRIPLFIELLMTDDYDGSLLVVLLAFHEDSSFLEIKVCVSKVSTAHGVIQS